MVLVLCLNAAVDKTVSVRRLSPGRRALAFAAALATASARVPGAGVFRKRDLPCILARVKVRELR